MKVVVKTNFRLSAMGKDDMVEVDLAAPVLKSVLEHISVEYQKGRPVINPVTHEVDPEEYTVLLNGSAYQFLPQRLLTPLSEGDEVRLYRWFELLGGG